MSLRRTHTYLAPSETKREGVSAAQKWAVGLIEGDGHLSLTWSNKEKTNLSPVLKVTLHDYNARAIYKLKHILGAGHITHHDNLISLRLRSEKTWWGHVWPLFKACALRSHRYYDALIIMHVLHVKLTVTHGLHNQACRKQAYFKHCRKLLAQATKQNASRLSPVWMIRAVGVADAQAVAASMPVHVLRRALDLDWLAGFVEAEGSFYICPNGRHGFALGQTHDGVIIAAVHRYFGVSAELKLRGRYVLCDTTDPAALKSVARALHKRLRGMKSFVFTLWTRSLRQRNTSASAVARRLIARATRYERTLKTDRTDTRYSPS